MAYAGTASGRFLQMDGKRRGLISRIEKYAAFTIPKLCLPNGHNENSNELSHDFQALGAQAVNHLANKIMLALFAPSRPFFRMDANKELKAELTALGADLAEIEQILSLGEKDAIAQLDRMSMRPKLYEAVKLLIVTGNALMILMDDTARIVGIKNYVARRGMTGKLHELIHADKLMFDELEPEVQAIAAAWMGGTYANKEDREITLYRWIKRLPSGDYYMTQWLDDRQLPKQFDGKWPEDKLPYRALTWDLSDGHDYGTGLVEDYQGDFAGLSLMSKAQIMGAVLASEFRWLVNPAGMTSVEDVQNSENGAAIPGNEGDVTIIQSNKSGDLQVVNVVGQEYIQRIGRGFLLGTAVTRDAERVTAEEIRMQANELETSLGGAYSRLAVDFQIPMAYWLMDIIGFSINDKRVKPSIVTGLDALSRNGDLDDLKLLLSDLAQLASLPEPLLVRLDLEGITKRFAAARRQDTAGILLSPEQLQANEDRAMARAMQAQAQETGVAVAGEVAKSQAQGTM